MNSRERIRFRASSPRAPWSTGILATAPCRVAAVAYRELPGARNFPAPHIPVPVRRLLLVISTVACAPSVSVRSTPQPSAAAITPADLRTRLFALAHDSMMGRAPGDAGNYKATAWVAAEFARFGLEPAGDNGTWFQVLPFFRRTVDRRDTLRVDGYTAPWNEPRETDRPVEPLFVLNRKQVRRRSCVEEGLDRSARVAHRSAGGRACAAIPPPPPTWW